VLALFVAVGPAEVACTIRWRSSGKLFRSEAEKLNPDLIILDLAMPVMTGLDAAPLLRKALPDARLIHRP
jgi:CheY-like chemotaxis protein